MPNKKDSICCLFILFQLISYQPIKAETVGIKAPTKLSFLGAELESNFLNTIPDYKGEKTPIPKDWLPGDHYIDPYSEDKLQNKIDVKNLEKYKPYLSEGQIQLLLRFSEYYLPIYQSRRSARYPAFIVEGTKHNQLHAKLTDDGNGLRNYKEGFPFPILSEKHELAAIQSLWNHRTRYRGGHVERTVMQTTVFGSENFTPVRLYQRFSRAERISGLNENERENALFFYLDKIQSPARLSGTTILVHETFNQTAQSRRAWIYNLAQKRVRRAPSVAYDAPVPGTYGLRTADSYDMFNGSTDKYDWQYLGKQELYIPYNAYRLASNNLTYDQILTPSTINPEVQRWELHRVHKLEARLKTGERHIYAKRIFYLDEDSWTIVLTEQYDSRGELWRVSEGHLINYYDQDLPYYSMEVTYDLLNNRYNVFGLSNEEDSSYTFNKEFNLGDYVPNALRRNTSG